MNKTAIGILSFVAGAAAGAAVTWKMLKTKYEQIAQEEIDSVREAYSEYFGDEDEGSAEDEDDDTSNSDRVEEDPEVSEYKKTIKDAGYASEEKEEKKVVKKTTKKTKGGKKMSKTRVITPEEFDDLDGDYQTETLYYYADGVLTNDDDIAIEEELMCPEAVEEFENGADVVYAADDNEKVRYEICRDNRPFNDEE